MDDELPAALATDGTLASSLSGTCKAFGLSPSLTQLRDLALAVAQPCGASRNDQGPPSQDEVLVVI